MNFLTSAWFWYSLMGVAFILTIINAIRHGQTDDTVRVPRKVDTFNLAIASPQEVFNWVVYNLRVQARQSRISYSNDGIYRCAYRGEDDTKCAAGWLIADEHYSDDLEGAAWPSIHMCIPGAEHTPHNDLIFAMQAAHDNGSFNVPSTHDGSVWYRLHKVAERFRLDPYYIDAPI